MPAVPRHRQPIITAAVALFRRQGFARTGLNDIVDISGAPKGSLYHYFPLGKSSIVEEAAGCDCRKLGDGMRFNRRIAARTCKSARGLDTDIRISQWLPDHDRAVGTRAARARADGSRTQSLCGAPGDSEPETGRGRIRQSARRCSRRAMYLRTPGRADPGAACSEAADRSR